MMKRIIAIDYGERRCGLAWTDPLRISINPLETIQTDQLENRIIELIQTEEVGDIVFGLPQHKDGSLTKVGHIILKKIEKFKIDFPDITFHVVDESFTSQRARQLMVDLGTKKKKRRQKESVDRMSAVLILRDFLEKL